MAAILMIYNHYVEFSISAPETEQLTLDDISQRFARSTKAALPCLVACERNGSSISKSRGRSKHHNDLPSISDRVVGFAFATEFHDSSAAFRSTAKLNVYTHQQYYMQGVAKCLVDKLVGTIDSEYSGHSGCEYQASGRDGDAKPRGIRNIVVEVPFDPAEPEKLDWMGRWLTRQDGLAFKRVGVLERVGRKGDRDVSIAIFQRVTAPGGVVGDASPGVLS